jgi:predicted HTH transcriptional regulator
MTPERTDDYLVGVIKELVKLPRETEWVEFKANNPDPIEIGEYISALSNSAALCEKTYAYLVWGVHDASHALEGTTFSFRGAKKGGEELENWVLKLLTPKIDFKVHEFEIDGKLMVVLEIPPAQHTPVQFQGIEYLRIGSYKKKMKEHPEKERELWRVFDREPFEKMMVSDSLSADEVLALLDYPAYFRLLGIPLPDGKENILDSLARDGMLQRSQDGRWGITNLGAILFANKLSEFEALGRKAFRVVFYQGADRTKSIREQLGTKGYASGFEGLMDYIQNALPANEVMKAALRHDVSMYPLIAVRELVANSIIHQDFHVSGSGPMVEIFSNRMEITNPGKPLVEPLRFLDSPPKSRNELLAAFMRRVGVCEERGSGVDKVVFQTEFYQLPAPVFEIAGDNTRAVLFAHRPLSKMDKADRIRACYLHSCLRWVSRDYMTNTSLRERFGIKKDNSSMASRYIREAVAAKAIKTSEEKAPPKTRKYVPFWA